MDAQISPEALADQLRMPHGPLAAATAQLLNHRNRPLIERSIDALDVHPDHRVLDIGFGGGVSLSLLLGQVTSGEVRGVDPSWDMVRRARTMLRWSVATGRLAVDVAAVDALPFDDGAFDRLLSVQTVYFWADTAAGLAEIDRVTTPGGHVVLAMMCREDQEANGFIERGYRLFDEHDLGALLEQAGFTAITASRQDGAVVLSAEKPVPVAAG